MASSYDVGATKTKDSSFDNPICGAMEKQPRAWDLDSRFRSSDYSYLWLARSEGMDPYSSPYVTHCSNFHVLFHSFIPS